MISLMVVKKPSVQCMGRQSLIVCLLMLQSKYDGDISVKSLKSSTMDLSDSHQVKHTLRNMLP